MVRVGSLLLKWGVYIVLASFFCAEMLQYSGLMQFNNGISKFLTVTSFLLWLICFVGIAIDRLFDRASWFSFSFFLFGTACSSGLLGHQIKEIANLVIAVIIFVFPLMCIFRKIEN